MKPVFIVDNPVFDTNSETYISDFIRKFSNKLGIDKHVIISEEYDSNLVKSYRKLLEMAEKDGCKIYEVPRYMTDGHKGKQEGKKIFIANDLNLLEKIIVGWHEYLATGLEKHDDRKIQKYEEYLFSPYGPMPNPILYKATIEMGKRAGIR
ncbi:MAG: hypothetical protein QXD48_03685 [Candidatus Aenigmatarchaeota archaeon]